MLEIILIRHGKTYGNTKGKYIGGKTDESLCEEGTVFWGKDSIRKSFIFMQVP